jgi:hypothetical protein
MNRKIEVYRDEEWVETPFEALQVGDVFRLWEPVIDKDPKFGEVVAWRCMSPPEEKDGIYGCMTAPAMTAPKEVTEPTAEPSEPPPTDEPAGPPVGPYNNRFG